MCILPPVAVKEFFEVCTKLLGVPWGCEVEELLETCGPVGNVDKYSVFESFEGNATARE